MIIAVFMYGNIIIFLENIAFIFFYHLVTAPYIFYNFRSLLFLFFLDKAFTVLYIQHSKVIRHS